MIPKKIRTEIENSSVITNIIGIKSTAHDWQNFTRTTFERIARRINQEVTRKVIDAPFLVKDFLLFGEHEFDNILFKYKLKNIEDFIEHLKGMNHQKPYSWISGKTLQGYWNGGDAKDKKLNVLLTFLGVNLQDWDDWKNHREESVNPATNASSNKLNDTLWLLRKHFVGHYYRYYQKTDNSPVLIKTPFIIREDPKDIVVVETKTMGHQYKSAYMIIRNGALYIECENMDWNEKESYIFNIGFETNAQVMIGVSNTLNRKGQAIAIKNVLVKQNQPFDYHTMSGVEVPFEHRFDPSSEEARVVSFFKNGSNIITTPYCYTLEELSSLASDKTSGVFEGKT
ncbi:hypothetical protein C900_05687 [Fulvivirga imtechensis AK7]|uniref:Uncharacterized protein n=1 Tax=Fulvivirga imtechensis AK7 TaxID=1237149 RepID=L8JJ01_9BACT|nr:hypothetical protein [Fulvivirga imtechensis]ELR68861.1 hypothetical protein C900_05687 [Fulvivirga imtechensis AK7]